MSNLQSSDSKQISKHNDQGFGFQVSGFRGERSDKKELFSNKIEGVNRTSAEAGEKFHHLFIAKLRGYITFLTPVEDPV